MVIVVGQLDHSSFPKALILSAPCRTNQLLKSETLMLYCLLVYSFIYLFWIHQCTKALHGALNRELHKACIFSHVVH